MCDTCQKRITGLPSKIGLCDEENSANCNTGLDSQGSSRSQDICSDKGDENYLCQEEEITGYMVVEYDEHWWIGCVLESNKEKREVTMNFLHPHGPGQFFSFRDPPDIFTVDLNDLLLAVEPKSTTGWSYFISSEESKGATKALNLHHC